MEGVVRFWKVWFCAVTRPEFRPGNVSVPELQQDNVAVRGTRVVEWDSNVLGIFAIANYLPVLSNGSGEPWVFGPPSPSLMRDGIEHVTSQGNSSGRVRLG